MSGYNSEMKIIEGKSISWVKGFQAIGIASGIKSSGAKDMCLIYSERPAAAAASFTTNVVKAAPVVLDIKNIEGGSIRALIVNSGNANACTGEEGYADAVGMAGITAEQLGIAPESVLVYSTGVIGVRLPMDKVRAGIVNCSKSLVSESEDHAAEAIMTTDLSKKSIFVQMQLSGKTISIAGIAKGSGMIHPNMATMLSYVVTDANITSEMLKKIQKSSVEKSFNMISVDGDTSTNDSATLLANGFAENDLIDSENDDYYKLQESIDYINTWLAKKIAADGEGATKLVEIDLKGAYTDEAARKMAKSVISSSLVKTAMHGADANWGRILCAMGYSGACFVPDKANVSFVSSAGKLEVFRDGKPIIFDEGIARAVLSENEVSIQIVLADGNGSAKAWGCDLSAKYVEINGNYRS